MCSEHVPQKLIRNIFPAAARQFADFEYFFKITVAFDDRGILDLKVGLGQFCLEQDRSNLHVDFSPLNEAAMQRNTRLESKLRQITDSSSQDQTELFSVRHAGIAEYVHQQSIGTHRGIEFLPATIAFRQCAVRAAVNFSQSFPPLWPPRKSPI